jgi:hypothetical protein
MPGGEPHLEFEAAHLHRRAGAQLQVGRRRRIDRMPTQAPNCGSAS